jgi:hypothetical protein
VDPPDLAAPARLEREARAFAEARGIKFGHFVHPVRAAVSGTTKGAGLFDLLWLVGREASIARLRRHAAR